MLPAACPGLTFSGVGSLWVKSPASVSEISFPLICCGVRTVAIVNTRELDGTTTR